MEPDDRDRDQPVEPEDLGLVGSLEQVHRDRKDRGADDAGERHVAAELEHQEPGDGGDPDRHRREAEHDTGRRGDALPAPEADEHREDVAQDRREPARQREELRVRYLRPEDEHRYRSLGDVHQADGNGVAPSQRPIHVGGTQIPAAVLPEIDTAEQAPGEIAGRNRSDEVGGEEPEPGRRDAHRLEPRLVNFSRTGEPVNGHASRKPLERYRW